MIKRKLMSIWYIVSLIILLSLFWIIGEDYLLTNKIIVTAFTFFLGFKFDLELVKVHNWFFLRFKKEWLNTLNLAIQAWILVLLLGNLSVLPPSIKGSTAIIFILAFFGFLLFYPLFYFRVFKKTNSLTLVILDIVIMAISSLFVFYNLLVGFPAVFVIINSNWIIYFLFLCTSMFIIYQWYRYTIKENHFNSQSNWKLSLKLIVSVVLFLIIIFPIDSSLWLHPLKNWNFTFNTFLDSTSIGIREEVLFRGIALTLLLWVLRKKNNYIITSISIQGILFGLMHLINLSDPSVLASSVIASTIDAAGIGILFAVIYLTTKNIWVPIILHSIWDYLQTSMTGAMNMSVGGTLGFIITCSVGIASVAFSYVLYVKNDSVIKNNVMEILVL